MATASLARGVLAIVAAKPAIVEWPQQHPRTSATAMAVGRVPWTVEETTLAHSVEETTLAHSASGGWPERQCTGKRSGKKKEIWRKRMGIVGGLATLGGAWPTSGKQGKGRPI